MACFFRSDGPCCPPYFVQEVTIQSMGVLSSGNAKLKPTKDGSDKRVPLSRERVLQAAIAVADAAGVRALTIRSLAAELGVKPMSVYYYFANKSEILDGIVDVVFSEIDLPTSDGDWQSVIRHRAISARRVLARHPWVSCSWSPAKLPALRRCDTTTP